MIAGLATESAIRLLAFLAIAVVLVVGESFSPRRADTVRNERWPGNLGVFMINVLMLLALPVSAVAAASLAAIGEFGVFYRIEAGFWFEVLLSVLILDGLIYWQHRLFHRYPLLWRIHRMHHGDADFDLTTSLRFHPLEIFLSILIKALAILLLGAPVFAVILFEIILNGSAMFNHSNIRIPLTADRWIRRIIVTPDMHRVHHSIHRQEHSSNYGFALSIWDRLFRSYTDQPQDGHRNMRIGLASVNRNAAARLPAMLLEPFRN